MKNYAINDIVGVFINFSDGFGFSTEVRFWFLIYLCCEFYSQ